MSAFTDSAYLLQTATGIETICVETEQLEGVKGVMRPTGGANVSGFDISEQNWTL